jgi:hypothetical protein
MRSKWTLSEEGWIHSVKESRGHLIRSILRARAEVYLVLVDILEEGEGIMVYRSEILLLALPSESLVYKKKEHSDQNS